VAHRFTLTVLVSSTFSWAITGAPGRGVALADDGAVQVGFPWGLRGLVEGRLGFDQLLVGTTGGIAAGNVFAGGPATEIDLGVRADRVTLYLGFEHAFFGVGAESPYWELPSASAYGNEGLAGARYQILPPSRLINIWVGGDVGYEILHSDGRDGYGGAASIDLPNIVVRVGLGVPIHVAQRILVEPSCFLTLLGSTGNAHAAVTTAGYSSSTSTPNPSTGILGLSPGISLVVEL
jgi:hypothetical protein